VRSRRQTQQDSSFYEIFSDMALLMLAAFIFLFALILINAQLQGHRRDPVSKKELASIQKKLADAEHKDLKLQQEINNLASVNAQQQLDNLQTLLDTHDVQQQMNKIMLSAQMASGEGRKDFDMFIKGLHSLPGKDLHIVVDATGSMHGVTSFLIPVLRLIAIRSGKHLSALTWYADRREGTYTGSMAEMFDKLMADAPFVGMDETVGHAFRHIATSSPVPGAYLLIGDEPPTDQVFYHEIPAPVFTLPLGTSTGNTKDAFQKIANETGGRMLELKFQ